MPENKLHLLYNEARRQRTLNMVTVAKAFGSKDLAEEVDDGLAIHGSYTEGFYDQELNKLFGDFKK